jgi:wyosine [tRNA(Phe)-imidazoG37] synthetase (radical SAM superfamily)
MIEQEINSRFSELVGQGIIPEAIVVSGNGEPTLYPQLEEAMDLIHKYRDKFFPRTRTSVLSNGTMLSSDSVVRAINKLDDRSIKLDAGDMDVFRLVDIPLVPFSIEKLVAEIKRLKDCIIQSCFMKGKRSNVTLKSIESWIQAISRIKPKCVHIYSLDRVTPMQGLEVVDKETLLDIAGKLKQATGVEGLVF